MEMVWCWNYGKNNTTRSANQKFKRMLTAYRQGKGGKGWGIKTYSYVEKSLNWSETDWEHWQT